MLQLRSRVDALSLASGGHNTRALDELRCIVDSGATALDRWPTDLSTLQSRLTTQLAERESRIRAIIGRHESELAKLSSRSPADSLHYALSSRLATLERQIAQLASDYQLYTQTLSDHLFVSP